MSRRPETQRVVGVFSQPIRGPLPMLNACRGVRGRELMPASSSYTAAIATAMQMRDSAGPPHNESTLLRAACTPACIFHHRGSSHPRSLARHGPPVVFFFIIPTVISPLPRRARHLMKCHRCPTDCRVKCRRLLIYPASSSRLRGLFDFARRNAAIAREGRGKRFRDDVPR